MTLKGGRLSGPVRAENPLRGVTHYLRGGDPAHWHTNVASYGRLVVEAVYPGIDLVLRTAASGFEYDFVVAKGGDVAAVRMSFDADRVDVDPTGDLILQTILGDVRHQRPVAYQEAAGERRLVRCRFVRNGRREIGFEVGEFDRDRPLVIDPVIRYRTFVGGSGEDRSSQIATDGQGHSYVAGSTNSPFFPGSRVGPGGGTRDALLLKRDRDGEAVWSVVLGGSGWDTASGVAVSASGAVFVAGSTASADFPGLGGATEGGYMARFDAAGTFVWSRPVIGATTAVSVDGMDNAYVTGWAPDPQSWNDAIVVQFDPMGNAGYSTSLPGLRDDFGLAIAADASGNVYLTGGTNSPGPGSNPEYDAFVAKLDATGALAYLRYLIGNQLEFGQAVGVDAAGNAYVSGFTRSTDLATPGAVQPANAGDYDAFVTKLHPAGAVSTLTYLGGPGRDDSWGIAVTPAGSVTVSGWTTGAFPLVDPVQDSRFGSSDLFVTRFNADLTAMEFSSYVGSERADIGGVVALDGGAMVLAGFTQSESSSFDVFLSRVDVGDQGINLLPSTTRWKPQRDTATDDDGDALNPIKIEFSSPSPLKSATVTISGPSGVPPISQTFDPANAPDPYVIKWNGFATDASGNATYFNPGDYIVAIAGVKEDDGTIRSSENDPNATVSLVEVTKVELCEPEDSEGCIKLADVNPPVSTLPDQDPPQARAYNGADGGIDGGKRIFAEARFEQEPGGGTTIGPVRNRVKVRATIAPRIEDYRGQNAVQVFFKSFDVDDPAPYTPDLDNDPEGQVPSDNRGSPKEGVVEEPIVDVAAGGTTANTFFRTSLQPGDNHRIAASTSQQWVMGLRAVQPSTTGELAVTALEKPTNVSEMLTVWRTLHLEVDSMGSAPAERTAPERNFLCGEVVEIPGNEGTPTILPQRAVLSPEVSTPALDLADKSPNLDDPFPEAFGLGRFEKGTLCIGLEDPPETAPGICSDPAAAVSPIDGNGKDHVQVAGGIDVAVTVEPPSGSGLPVFPSSLLAWDSKERRFTLGDTLPDDYLGGRVVVGGVGFTSTKILGDVVEVAEGTTLDFCLRDDDAADSRMPFVFQTPLTHLQPSDDPAINLLAQAYIRPSYDLPSARAADFNRNVSVTFDPSLTEFKNQLAAGREAVGRPDLWAAYVQFGFQEDETGDLDPGTEVRTGIPLGGTPLSFSGTLQFLGADGTIIFVEPIREHSLQAGVSENDCIEKVILHELAHHLGMPSEENVGVMQPDCFAFSWHYSSTILERIRGLNQPLR